MNPSKLLRRFIDTGTKPSSQREASALLDESRSIIASQLQSTSQHIQNFTDGDIDQILAGGKTGAMARAQAIHQKYANAAPTPRPAPAPRPAAQLDRIAELCAFITQPRKPFSVPVAKAATPTAPSNKFTAATDSIVQQAALHRSSPPADKAQAIAELKRRGFTVTASGIVSKSFRKS